MDVSGGVKVVVATASFVSVDTAKDCTSPTSEQKAQ